MCRSVCLAGFICFVAGLWTISAMWAQEPPRSESETTDFELSDFRGRLWSLADFHDKSAVVVAFLGTECPLAIQYSLRLQEFSKRYADRGVQVLGIDSNRQDSLEKMATFARRQKIEFPFLKDNQAKVADQYGATRTPEVFLLNQDRKIVYQGRIDDQFGIGYARNSPQTTELIDAVESLLNNRPIVVAQTSPVGCLIGRKRESGDGESNLTYATHVATILNNHCVRCHRADQIGPFPLDNYEDASAWSEMIAEVVREKRMPPWHANPEHGTFANDCSLAADDERILLEWIAAGSPSGDLDQLPTAPTWTNGWQLPREPDFVCHTSPRPFTVKATGDIKYKYFVVDPKFTEDKWIQAAELRPGTLSVVHHILCFILPPGAQRLEQEVDGFLVGYVPGMLPPPLPPGYAKKVEAGSSFVFQVHYTPNGREVTDHSQLGLIFADEASVTHEVITTCAVNPRIKIPPHDAHHKVKALNRHPLGEWEVLSLMPHMHLRGKAFRYEAVFSDGRREVLLDVPRFDFNWQTSYQFAKPWTIPVDTRIECFAVFDNSSENLNNPDPSAEVRWGDQTWEEMMIGYFDIALPRDVADRVRQQFRAR